MIAWYSLLQPSYARTFGSAPRSSNSLAAATGSFATSAAAPLTTLIKGVSPSADLVLTSAPRSQSSWTTDRWAPQQAAMRTVGATRELGNAHENVAGARFLSRARAPRTRWGLAKPDPLAGGLARFHGYLAMAEAFILLHLPPAFLHCFFVPASETSDPSAPRQWRLAFANAAGEAARANAAIRANFIQLLLGRMCLLAILARALGLASIELARTVGGAWPPGRTSVKEILLPGRQFLRGGSVVRCRRPLFG